MIRHHPDDAWLLEHAAGRLHGGDALVVATHLETCEACRAAVRRFEQAGAALVLDEPAVPMSDHALARTLARLDAPTALVAPPALPRPALPAGMNWPRSLRRCEVSRWRPLAPGMRWSRVRLPWDRSANVMLLRIAAGVRLPRHTHTGSELTQVLHGAFDDGRAVLGRGDFDATDSSVHHQPVAEAGCGECICLASVDGHLRFDGWLSRWLGALAGF
jgi:putative transcriptional regulator